MAELWRVEDSLDLYGINRWGRDYFSANRKGHLLLRPNTVTSNYADIFEIVEALRKDGVQTPVLLRCPQLIGDRIERQYLAFEKARKDYGY
ncbi:MAG: arginine decarboxylase, partial [Euryarchaeota archaeon]|nr:arginine decarboxylase [Euryarchaeota archaeon]